MTYIITLTKEQFDTLYTHLLDCRIDDLHILNGIIAALELSQEHYAEREATLKELLGITS